jgi:oligopeptide/dipeptide ABC transporter ATP-binding protein
MCPASSSALGDVYAPTERVEAGPVVVDDLNVEYETRSGRHHAVKHVGFQLSAGEVIGIAGESGSGKTAVALSLIGLLADNATVTGSIRLSGREMVGSTEKVWREARGRLVSMIFQETASALNPTVPIGRQLAAVFRSNLGLAKREAQIKVVEALQRVQLNDAERILHSYPHQLSGGMCQRAVIAMAVSCGAQVLIADEPTTALDVTVQREILDLLRHFAETAGFAVVLISHDLSVLENTCDKLLVMYQGEVVESGPTQAVLGSPQHPYTKNLLACTPSLHVEGSRLREIRQADKPSAEAECLFRGRCDVAFEKCCKKPPLAPSTGTVDVLARCWRVLPGSDQ